MASALNTKINSYALERGIEFDQSFTTTPIRTGTNPLINAYTQNSTSSIVYESTVGPVGGAGSWNYQWSTTSGTNSYFRAPASSTNELLGVNDQDYSVGVWFKLNDLPTGISTAAASLFQITSNSTGFLISISGSTASTPSKLNMSIAGTTSFGDQPNSLTANTWYYLAVRRKSNVITVYLNNSVIWTTSHTGTSIASTWMIGDTSARAFNGSYNASNYYLTTADEIDATAISEIWTAGSGGGTNISITETPATADAMFAEPTIIVVTPDYTQITTSIVASAIFPDDISIIGNVNINNIVTEVLTADAELINNVIISTGTDESFSAAEFTATAELVEPVFPRPPMTASATMPDPIITIPQSYYKLVKDLNPLFYTNLDASTITNFGSWTGVSYVVGSTVTKNLPSTGDMALIGAGKSWRFTGNTSANNNRLEIIPSSPTTTIRDLILSKNYAIEYWTKITNDITGVYSGTRFDIGNIDFKIDGEIITFTQNAMTNGFTGSFNNLTPINGNFYSTSFQSNLIKLNDWNHVAITINQNVLSIWVNGSLLLNSSRIIDTGAVNAASVNYTEAILYDGFDTNDGGSYIDEIAIYGQYLTNSEIIDHYSFINNQSPDRNITSSLFQASSISGEHNFIVNSNAIIFDLGVTASAIIVDPNIVAEKLINFNATFLTASAENTDVNVYYGWTIVATPIIAYSELINAYRLSDLYSAYVQANIAPYRYVTFDGDNPYLDYGTDNGYSVVPTVVNGTIVNPDLGINGKSALTAGTSYITDGVILKESEWNDSWGTGQNSYHSAFWFQRAQDDNSTTGLRVLWNLNGYKDNQHVVLYQYQNKLHMQFNNGSGTWIEQDTETLDLFDYQRHFVVIEFDHTNTNNNTVRLYVDAVLEMTVDLGAYTGTTTNETTADSGPNDELNNHPRLSVGCLITPFASTALPVVPANTKLIIDEIYWDKNAITETQVTSLFNIMPDKDNSNYISDPFLASSELVMPATTTSSVLLVVPFTALVELLEPLITADREVITSADAMIATANFEDAVVFEDKIIASDVFVATATFNDAGVIITIPAQPMTLTATLIEASLVNGVSIRRGLTPYVKYLRNSNFSRISIPRLREVK